MKEKEKERVRLSYGGKRVIRNKREIAGQNNNRGQENKLLGLVVCGKSEFLSFCQCVSVGAAGCQVTSG